MPGMTNPPAPTPTSSPSPTPTAGGGATTSGTGTTNAGTGGSGTSTTSGTPPDGAGAGTTGAQGTGQGDSSSQGTGDNHTLINDPVLEHLNRYGLSEGPSLSSRLAQAEQNKYDLLRKGLAAGVANLTQSQIEQILTPGPNSQSSEEVVERVMTRQHEAAKEQTYAAYFYNAFANIFVGDVAEAPNNALGVTGSVGLGLTGLDVYKDVSDLGYSLWNFKPTCGHVADVALNTIAIVPVIGVVKNLKKGADLVDSGADLAKAGSDVADAAADAVKAAKVDPPKGGEYQIVRSGNSGGQVHHTPSAKVTPYEYRKAPSIWMDTLDHKKTASWGSSKPAEEFRNRQDALIRSGRLREAIQLDIDNIRALFGSKYDDHIKQMLQSFGYTN